MTKSCIKYSLVIPVYKNEENLSFLLSRLDEMASAFYENLEIIFVIDGSPDNSRDYLEEILPKYRFPSVLVSHSKNFGSFPAIRTGLSVASGDYTAVMSADSQEPNELIIEMFNSLEKDGYDLSVGVRKSRKDKLFGKIFSALFWKFYSKSINPDLPHGGVDVFAINRKVLQTLLLFEESNSSLIAQLYWVGFKRSEVYYHRQERRFGKSQWTLKKKFKYMADSVFSFTNFPLLSILVVSGLVSFLAIFIFIYAATAWVQGQIEVPGYLTILGTQLFLSSSILFSQGILGVYIWRTYENSKMRPISVVDTIQKYNR